MFETSGRNWGLTPEIPYKVPDHDQKYPNSIAPTHANCLQKSLGRLGKSLPWIRKTHAKWSEPLTDLLPLVSLLRALKRETTGGSETFGGYHSISNFDTV